MKIAITGASGKIGSALVPALTREGHDLLLVGRDAETLKTMHPAHSACSYADLSEAGKGASLLVHLAVLNNREAAKREEFERVNVELFRTVIASAAQAGIPALLHVSRQHALDATNQSDYAVTKRAALEIARQSSQPRICNLFLPKVIAVSWVPNGLEAVIASLASFVKPAIEGDAVTGWIARLDPARLPGDTLLLRSKGALSETPVG